MRRNTGLAWAGGALGFCLGFSTPAAALIDFESIPGATPTEGLEISNQFVLTDGVIFRLEDGTNPKLAQVGAPITAFAGPPNNNGSDNPLPGQGIGEFFLTDDGVLNNSLNVPALIIGYGRPTSAASGVILDVDFDETFTIQARDLGENVIDTVVITAGDPGTGDGAATFWSFDLPSDEIFSIRIAGSRSQPGGFGLGFDLFNARSAGVRGDYNGNGLVEQGDLNQVLNNWGAAFDAISASWVIQRPTEGIVDQAELNAVLNNWGGTATAGLEATAVPEPAGLVTLATGLLGGLGLRRRRVR